jgi:Asp-tRNA(Asn)/Glu-tRNA(Gln) amidotransferase A subunit family amidase
MGIGTDIGGSIRGPAFYCGIFGHKPTTGNYFSLNPAGVHAVLHESPTK